MKPYIPRVLLSYLNLDQRYHDDKIFFVLVDAKGGLSLISTDNTPISTIFQLQALDKEAAAGLDIDGTVLPAKEAAEEVMT